MARRVKQFAGKRLRLGGRDVPAVLAVAGQPLFVQKVGACVRVGSMLPSIAVCIAPADGTRGVQAGLYPGCFFMVGYDTAVRIVDSKYYNNSTAELVKALGEIQRHGCRFLVLGRVGDDGAFLQLEDMQDRIPVGMDGLFVSVPDFRMDISSTELRAKAAARRESSL